MMLENDLIEAVRLVADTCFAPTQDKTLQAFIRVIEELVLSKDVKGYTAYEMMQYILFLLVDRMQK